MLHQDETDKPLIAIWIPEAMEWSMLGSNREEEGGGGGGGGGKGECLNTHTHTYKRTSEQ